MSLPLLTTHNNDKQRAEVHSDFLCAMPVALTSQMQALASTGWADTSSCVQLFTGQHDQLGD